MSKYVIGRKFRDRKKKRWKWTLFLSIVFIILYIPGETIVPGWLYHAGVDLSSEKEYGSKSVVDADAGSIPDYSGDDLVVLNNGKPNFNLWDLENIQGEHYSELDGLGRCGTAYAMLDRSMMPIKEREEIREIRPSGWRQERYEGIVDSDPPYLYNRCHLIAYALTGQNANERNLITGTRYMNVTSMLPLEMQVMRYLDDSRNHVLYRVSPYFMKNELLARGVELEAYSVEDNGAGVCFHVFLYNVQPGILIDYLSGKSRISG